MDTKEHISNYDPKVGHYDKNTNAPGFNYFFLGNGAIEVAIQYCKSGKGTPLGLLIMDPDKIGQKSNVYTFDERYGLERTMINVQVGKNIYQPDKNNLLVEWVERDLSPVVYAIWSEDFFEVHEIFYCLSKNESKIARVVVLRNNSDKTITGTVRIDLNPSAKKKKISEFKFKVKGGEEKEFFFVYELIKKNKSVISYLLKHKDLIIDPELYLYNQLTNSINFYNRKLDFLFFVSKSQISATISKNAKMDASVWQYNREWVRDMSNVALGNLFAGYRDVSKKILQRLIDEFVDDTGSTVDSSVVRPKSEVELDQNGILLYAIWQYWVWTDEKDIITKNWSKIKALAEFPLDKYFWDKKSKLLKNSREYWERHDAHGVTEGFELTYQIFPVLGLQKASEMAEEMGENELAKRWKSISDEIWNSFLNSKKYALIEDGKLIKRRKFDGTWHKAFEPPNRNLLPEGTPLREEYYNPIDPDTSVALPIAFKMIDPKSNLAKKTLESLELLWNQRWYNGGYGRYNIKSEPDSPGPWPFATMFVTRAYIENGNRDKVIRNLDWMIDISEGTGSWFEFYGWRPIPPCPPPGIIPWVWAEILICLVYNMIGIQPTKNSIIIKPKLLKITEKISSKFFVSNNLINLDIEYSSKIKQSYAILNKKEKILLKNGVIEIPKIGKNVFLKIYLNGKDYEF